MSAAPWCQRRLFRFSVFVWRWTPDAFKYPACLRLAFGVLWNRIKLEFPHVGSAPSRSTNLPLIGCACRLPYPGRGRRSERCVIPNLETYRAKRGSSVETKPAAWRLLSTHNLEDCAMVEAGLECAGPEI